MISATKTLCLLATIRAKTADRQPFFKDELLLFSGLDCGGKMRRLNDTFELYKN